MFFTSIDSRFPDCAQGITILLFTKDRTGLQKNNDFSRGAGVCYNNMVIFWKVNRAEENQNPVVSPAAVV